MSALTTVGRIILTGAAAAVHSKAYQPGCRTSLLALPASSHTNNIVAVHSLLLWVEAWLHYNAPFPCDVKQSGEPSCMHQHGSAAPHALDQTAFYLGRVAATECTGSTPSCHLEALSSLMHPLPAQLPRPLQHLKHLAADCVLSTHCMAWTPAVEKHCKLGCCCRLLSASCMGCSAVAAVGQQSSSTL